MKPPDFASVAANLAHHDAAIGNLTGRIHAVENKLDALGASIQASNSALVSQIGELGKQLQAEMARPSFNWREALSAIVSAATLFALVVGGIIWVNQAISAPSAQLVLKHDVEIERLERLIEELKDRKPAVK